MFTPERIKAIAIEGWKKEKVVVIPTEHLESVQAFLRLSGKRKMSFQISCPETGCLIDMTPAKCGFVVLQVLEGTNRMNLKDIYEMLWSDEK